MAGRNLNVITVPGTTAVNLYTYHRYLNLHENLLNETSLEGIATKTDPFATTCAFVSSNN